ncbi:MAG: hypothetical protein E7654_01885 [Ruminococcaceae bacterium]|nr:hypothetical protein [Oscillospiraceae bacterium]
MQFDRKSVDRMLNMEDDSLRQLIAGLARDAGIDPAALKVSAADLAALRRAVGSMSDEELRRMAGQLEQNGGKNHGQ